VIYFNETLKKFWQSVFLKIANKFMKFSLRSKEVHMAGGIEEFLQDVYSLNMQAEQTILTLQIY
jgi:hypothetical protein